MNCDALCIITEDNGVQLIICAPFQRRPVTNINPVQMLVRDMN